MADSGNGKTREIKIEFKHSPDYRVFGANGVWGGLTPKGDLMMVLIEDHGATPLSITHVMEEGGRLGPEKERDTGGATLTRYLQAGVTMSPQHAELIAKWMLSKVEEYKKQVEEAKK